MDGPSGTIGASDRDWDGENPITNGRFSWNGLLATSHWTLVQKLIKMGPNLGCFVGSNSELTRLCSLILGKDMFFVSSVPGFPREDEDTLSHGI